MIVCKYCAHSKVWHQGEGACFFSEDCDCEAWEYGTYVSN